MDYKRAVAAAVTGLAATALIAAPVAAEEHEDDFDFEVLPLHVDPTSGPVGTVIDVAGEECVDESGAGDVGFALYIPLDEEFIETFDEGLVSADASGAWAGQLVVHEGTPPGPDYFVSAICLEAGGWDDFDGEEVAEALADADLEEAEILDEDPHEHDFLERFYEEVPFEVTAEADTAPATAPPAVAVVEQPTFTG
jgi:hypothetical protein